MSMQGRRVHMSPLQLMQRFYYDYNKTRVSSTHALQQPTASIRNNQTGKMTQFLRQYQSAKKGQSVCIDPPQSPSQRQSQTQNQKVPLRRKSYHSQQSKQCYFRNAFTSSHPFLLTRHNISEKPVQQCSLKTEPVQFTSSTQNAKLMSPFQNRSSLLEVKDKMVRIKCLKKERMDRVRYNYLVNNLYKGHQQSNGTNAMSGRTNTRGRYVQVNTKERIFPSMNSGKGDQ